MENNVVPKRYADMYEKKVEELVKKYKKIKDKDDLFRAVKSEIEKFIKKCDELTIIYLAIHAWEREIEINEDDVVNTLYFNPEFAMDESYFDYVENSYPHPFDLLSIYSLVLLSSLLLYSVIKEINPDLLHVPEQEPE